MPINFVSIPKPPQLPDYLAIKRASDTRLVVEAKAREAALEAARQAAAVAEAQRQAEAAKQAQVVSYAVGGSCVSWLQQLGVTDITTARLLINRESGCNPYARNPSSSACGIPQDINGCEVGYDPLAQLRWMLDYVNRRYGSFANAWAHELAYGWY